MAKVNGTVPVPVMGSWSSTVPNVSSSVNPPPTSPVMVPPTVYTAPQVIRTLVTGAAAVPVPWVTAQFWAGLAGCVLTVTAYAPVTSDANVNFTLPVPVTVRLSPPLSCNTKPEPVKPLTVPPTANPDEQVTVTLVTLAVAVPNPLVTTQVCVGLLGCVRTVTLYAPGTSVAKVNCCAPVPVTVRLSNPIFCNTNPEPVRPFTVPAMENFVEQITVTLVTLAVAFPEPFVTAHVWLGLEGCVSTVTL